MPRVKRKLPKYGESYLEPEGGTFVREETGDEPEGIISSYEGETGGQNIFGFDVSQRPSRVSSDYPWPARGAVQGMDALAEFISPIPTDFLINDLGIPEAFENIMAKRAYRRAFQEGKAGLNLAKQHAGLPLPHGVRSPAEVDALVRAQRGFQGQRGQDVYDAIKDYYEARWPRAMTSGEQYIAPNKDINFLAGYEPSTTDEIRGLTLPPRYSQEAGGRPKTFINEKSGPVSAIEAVPHEQIHALHMEREPDPFARAQKFGGSAKEEAVTRQGGLRATRTYLEAAGSMSALEPGQLDFLRGAAALKRRDPSQFVPDIVKERLISNEGRTAAPRLGGSASGEPAALPKNPKLHTLTPGEAKLALKVAQEELQLAKNFGDPEMVRQAAAKIDELYRISGQLVTPTGWRPGGPGRPPGYKKKPAEPMLAPGSPEFTQQRAQSAILKPYAPESRDFWNELGKAVSNNNMSEISRMMQGIPAEDAGRAFEFLKQRGLPMSAAEETAYWKRVTTYGEGSEQAPSMESAPAAEEAAPAKPKARKTKSKMTEIEEQYLGKPSTAAPTAPTKKGPTTADEAIEMYRPLREEYYRLMSEKGDKAADKYYNEVIGKFASSLPDEWQMRLMKHDYEK